MTREEYEQLFYNQQAGMDTLNDNSPAAQIQTATGRTMDIPGSPANKKQTHQDNPYDDIHVGTTVKHNTFGKETIVKLSSKHMMVKFEQGTKKFMFPSAFQDGFLSL